ncbi:MAG: hypothetical protein HY521_11550 [Proteobacteria bacterium]|nr:hypothetical protein [Pseudomonadota bacterium]
MATLTKEEAASAIFGAWRLACRDAGGMAFFDASIEGFWKSFYAALFVAPGYLFLKLLALSGAGPDFPLARFLALQSIAYVTGWVAFPLAMNYVADALQRRGRYLAFIVAFNWSNVLQMALLVLIAVMTAAGVLPGGLGMFATLIATFAIIYYEWFIARTALDLNGGQAGIVVAVDILLGILINAIAAGML